jgi:transcriptional regulator with XRE-family HTH domain
MAPVEFEPWQVPAWAIVREARRRAGLSQAELAQRAGTSQSAVARYERARALPSLATLYRLVGACGLDLRMRLEPHAADPRRPLIDEALARSTEDRLRANDALSRFATDIRRAPPDPHG